MSHTLTQNQKGGKPSFSARFGVILFFTRILKQVRDFEENTNFHSILQRKRRILNLTRLHLDIKLRNLFISTQILFRAQSWRSRDWSPSLPSESHLKKYKGQKNCSLYRSTERQQALNLMNMESFPKVHKMKKKWNRSKDGNINSRITFSSLQPIQRRKY